MAFLPALLPFWNFGQSYVVKQITITGLEKTKEKVVLRQLTFKSGDTIPASEKEALLLLNKNNVYNLGLFNVAEISDSVDGDFINFNIKVKERWYIWPNPYVATEERTLGEWWRNKDLDRIVVGAGLNWENLTGWNDRLQVYGQIGYSRRVSVSYNRPFLFPKAKIDAYFGLRYVNNKEVAFDTDSGYYKLVRSEGIPMRESVEPYIQLGKRFSPRIFLYLTANFQYFRIHENVRDSNAQYLTTGSLVEYYPTLTLSFVNDQRDLRTFPLKGYKYSLLAKQSGLPGFGSTTFTKFAASFSHYIPLSKRFNFSYGSQGFILLGNRVPFFDKFFIGFDNIIRGYEPFVVNGSMLGILKTEMKFAVIPRRIVHVKQIPFRKFQDFPLGIYLSAFFDGGYMHDGTFNNHDNYLKDKILAGWGLGLNFITMYDKLLRLEICFNRQGGHSFNFNTIIPLR